MLRLYGCFIALSLVPFQGVLHGQANAESELKTKILDEWDSLLKKIRTARWEKKVQYYSSRETKELKLNRTDVIRRAFKRGAGSLASSEEERLDENMESTKEANSRVSNLQYAATLRKPNGGDAWVLTELKQHAKDLPEHSFEAQSCPWMELGNVPVKELLQEPGFVVTLVETVPGQTGTALSRAHFSYDGSRGNSSDSVKSGYIDFDVTHSYRPVAYQFQIKSKNENGVARGTVEYETSEGIPVPKVITDEIEIRAARKGLIFGKQLATFVKVEYNTDVRDEDFRLSAYGLPEPRGMIWRKPTPWYLWFIAGGAFLVGIGVLLGRRVARRKPPVSGASANGAGKSGS